MTLQDYLSREGLTYAAFGIRIGTKYPRTVERYAKGQQIPDRTMMLRIVETTAGEIMPNDFYGVGHAPIVTPAEQNPSPDNSEDNIGGS